MISDDVWKGRFVLVARPTSETKRIRYLLGLSSQAEREYIESEYFENDDAFQEMLTAEDDLIDAYAQGELVGEERRAFEKRFVRSLHRPNRISFARAFAGTVSATRSVETKLPDTLVNILRSFQSPGLFRTLTIAAVIVFVALLAWLVIDRRKLTNELRELRAESAELGKRIEGLQRSSDTERTRTDEIAAQLAERGTQSNKPRHRERGTTATQRMRKLPEVKNERENIASIAAEQALDKPLNPDAPITKNFQRKRITQLPLDSSNVANLLSLQPGSTTVNVVAESRTNQTNVTLNRMETLRNGSPFMFSLTPWNLSSSVETTIHIENSLTWIRFQVALERAAIHEDYRITIETKDGRPVTSLDWSEPLTPNQTLIDTPAVSTDVLSPRSYVLLLMGKEPDGSFVKVAEYPFKVIKY